MADDPLHILPEVRLVKPGETHRLCCCGHSPEMPNCTPGCQQPLELRPEREQRLLLCRCNRSAKLPYCDGSHSPPAPGLADKWRRFFSGR
ncbi:CDGSH iron-sulfur domain-containing protein [Ectopseudomonas guguanensis]|uniref:CDGSH iron-sulfur domain-containing protein n=1 Tax=Ectopseudomonas guguanensis TaxID=1198456 RepID=UPI0028A95AF0|nr:CDGSH iron-sulfur domain-containing protein [Pseudomonas guguanensis]